MSISSWTQHTKQSNANTKTTLQTERESSASVCNAKKETINTIDYECSCCINKYIFIPFVSAFISYAIAMVAASFLSLSLALFLLLFTIFIARQHTTLNINRFLSVLKFIYIFFCALFSFSLSLLYYFALICQPNTCNYVYIPFACFLN